MSAAHFEAKKHAYRQCQDGIVVSFLIHPADISSEIAMAALGTRFMVAFAEIGDDEREKEQSTRGPSNGARQAVGGDGREAEKVRELAAPTKDRRAFHDIPYSQQAGMQCGDKEFFDFLREQYTLTLMSVNGDAAAFVRGYCGVDTRADLDNPDNRDARKLWRDLASEFESWQTTQRYKDSVR